MEIIKNNEKKGIELKFNAKPSLEIREALKARGFRYSKFFNIWWKKDDPGTMESAQEIQNMCK